MINKLNRFSQLSLSRKIQGLSFLWSRLLTTTYYTWRLAECGARSIVGRPLFWTPENVFIGADVFIWSGSRIEAIELVNNALTSPRLFLGDGVSLQQRCHITFAGIMLIGKNTTIAFDVSIQDTDHEYKKLSVNVLTQPLRFKAVVIGENCFIGAGSRIQPGTILGRQCIVGANSVVRGVFPDYSVIVGSPAKIVKRYNQASNLWQRTNHHGEFINVD